MSFNNTICCESSFQKQFESLSLPAENYTVLLGLSGGADSTALLFLLNKFKEKYGYKLHAIHINHMIRGDEADRDEAFCKELCESLSVPFYSVRLNVPEISKRSKTGLEETARNIRYTEFHKLAEELSPCYIATAHNADDNVETVLFNLTRGTSLAGLTGIKKSRENIIRPILNLSKTEIIGYCEENGIKYITDSTNLDSKYSRNRIRNIVIPQLKQINPSLNKTVSRAADNLGIINDYMTLQAREFINELSDNTGIDISAFNNIHPALQKFIISLYVRDRSGISLEDVHISAVIGLCTKNETHSSVDIGGGYIAAVEASRLSVKVKTDISTAEYDIPLTFGVNYIPRGVIGVFNDDEFDKISDFKNIYKSSIQTPIRSDRIVGALRARTRLPGDVYNINGVNRKLKKLLNESEPDLNRRALLPLICDNERILWLPVMRSATGTFPKASEKAVILIYSYLD